MPNDARDGLADTQSQRRSHGLTEFDELLEGTSLDLSPSMQDAATDADVTAVRALAGLPSVDRSADPTSWELAAREFAAWRAGDRDALDRLVRLLTPVLWHLVRAYGLDRQSAEDVVQTTWLALVRNVDSVRDPQALLRWMTTTARREAWRTARAGRQVNVAESQTLEAALPAVGGPDTTVLAERTAHILWRHIGELPERCRRLLRVIAFEDRPDYASLSTELGIAVGSIGPTRGRCLDKLRGLLAADPEWSKLRAAPSAHSDPTLRRGLRDAWEIVDPAPTGVDSAAPLPLLTHALWGAWNAGQRAPQDLGIPRASRHPVIGLVTALPEEFAAMAAVVDDAVEWSIAGDPAGYLCGTIPSPLPGRPHPVVLTLLTEPGTNWAATAVANMLRSFESVDQVVMVGIAAGVPSPRQPERHVRLGDIVVGTWGIIDYDHVVDRPGEVALRQGFPQPSEVLSQRVKRLAAGELQGRRPWEDELALLLQRMPGFARPDPVTDRLYVRDRPVPHPDAVASGHRAGMPKVHEGRIGSASRSLRNADRRDALAREYDLRAIEVEGSGVGSAAFAGGRDWLVVRGISDYGDQRMGRLWRPYASAVAAAYTRALLRRCPPITSHGSRVL